MKRFLQGLMPVPAILSTTALLAVTCVQVLPMPETLFPSEGTAVELPVSFVWTACPGADSYVVQIDTAAGFSDPILSAACLDTTLKVSNDLPRALCFWRLGRAHRTELEWTSPVSFQVTGWCYPRRIATDIAVAARPGDLAVRPDGSEIWVGSRDSSDRNIYVVATDSPRVTHRVATDGYHHAELAFSIAGDRVFCSMGYYSPHRQGGEVEEFSTTSYTLTDRHYATCSGGCHSFPSGYGVCCAANDSFLLAASGDVVYRFELAGPGWYRESHELGLYDVAMASDSSRAFASSRGWRARLFELDTETLDTTRAVATDGSTALLALDADRRLAFVGHDQPPGFYAIDLAAFQVVASCSLPDSAAPFELAVSPSGDYLYLCDRDTCVVYVADVSNSSRPRFLESLGFPGGGITGAGFSPDGSRFYLAADGVGLRILEK